MDRFKTITFVFVFFKDIRHGLFILFFWVAHFAEASPNTITFQSRIIKPDGTALESTSVNFRFSITDTVGSCVIYQEDFNNRNMVDSKGLINLSIGAGTKVFPVGPMAITEVFNNYNSPTLTCQTGGNITAGATDRRKLIMQFNDGSGWQTVPAMDINSTPFSLQAVSAHKLGDFPAADYVRTATFPTCVGGEALHFNGASFTCVAVGAGAGTVTGVSSANADIAVSMASPTPVLTLNSGAGANQIVKLNGSSELPAVSGINLTALSATNLGSGTVPAARMPALTGDVTMTAGTTSTTLANNAVSNVHVTAAAGIARTKLATGSANHVLVNDGITGAMSSMGCNNGELIKWAAGVPTCSNDLGGAGDITNGGNTTGAAIVIGTNDAQNLQFETNNAPAMTILSGGNVGVGTANPSGMFEVGGINWVTAPGLTHNNLSITRTIAGSAHNNTTGSGLDVTSTMFTAGGINYMYYGVNSSPVLNNAAGVGTVYGIYSNPTAAGGGGTSTVYSAAFMGGNVGVGTATPGKQLDVTGTGRFSYQVLVGSGSALGGAGAGYLYVNRNTGATGDHNLVLDNTEFGANKSSSIDFRTGGSNYATIFGGQDASSLGILTFATGGGGPVERMRIGPTGNVGIGTTSPTSLLDLGGTFNISANPQTIRSQKIQTTISTAGWGGATGIGLDIVPTFDNGSGGNAQNFYGLKVAPTTVPGGGAVNSYGLYVAPLGSATNFYSAIFMNGNVGIGTSTPISKLEVSGDISLSSGSNRIIAVVDQTTNVNGNNLTLKAGDTPGKSSTAGNLYLKAGTNTAIPSDSAVGGNLYIDAGKGVDASGYIIIGTDVNPWGTKVGIGTTTPQATLDVNGYARLKQNGSAPVACSIATAGSIALNSTYIPCLCNGTDWYYLDSLRTGAVACVW